MDIAIDGPKKATDENKNVKLNNYMMLNSPSHTTTVRRFFTHFKTCKSGIEIMNLSELEFVSGTCIYF